MKIDKDFLKEIDRQIEEEKFESCADLDRIPQEVKNQVFKIIEDKEYGELKFWHEKLKDFGIEEPITLYDAANNGWPIFLYNKDKLFWDRVINFNRIQEGILVNLESRVNWIVRPGKYHPEATKLILEGKEEEGRKLLEEKGEQSSMISIRIPENANIVYRPTIEQKDNTGFFTIIGIILFIVAFVTFLISIR